MSSSTQMESHLQLIVSFVYINFSFAPLGQVLVHHLCTFASFYEMKILVPIKKKDKPVIFEENSALEELGVNFTFVTLFYFWSVTF